MDLNKGIEAFVRHYTYLGVCNMANAFHRCRATTRVTGTCPRWTQTAASVTGTGTWSAAPRRRLECLNCRSGGPEHLGISTVAVVASMAEMPIARAPRFFFGRPLFVGVPASVDGYGLDSSSGTPCTTPGVSAQSVRQRAFSLPLLSCAVRVSRGPLHPSAVSNRRM